MTKYTGFSRRQFIKNMALGSAALAVSPIINFPAEKILPKNNIDPSNFKYSMNQNWLFGGRFKEDAINPLFNDQSFKPVTIPHCVANLSWQNWEPSSWEDIWIYRRHFDLPEVSKGRRVFLHFEGVMVSISPVINGYELPQHQGGYLPFNYEITKWVKNKKNVLAVQVDSRWSNVPPTGTPKGVQYVDFLLPGGIYRPVWLNVVPQIFIDNVFAKPVNVLDENRSIEITCTLDAGERTYKSVLIRAELLKGDKIIASSGKEFKIDKISKLETVLTLKNLGSIKLWDINEPSLYDVVVTLIGDGKPFHKYRTRIGLREARFEKDGFFLNGKKMRLFGLDRHELFPYTGYAMPERVMYHDAEILKHELNCNAVRCSHYPQSEAFLNACDKLGLLVWEEVPGWGYIGDDAWVDLILRDVKDMVVRDRNHPSIIVWGVRANETENDPQLWGTTKAIAKALDDSRQTTGAMLGGIHSTNDWVQDVFASNDYSCNHKTGVMKLKKPVPDVPFMLSEAVGQIVGVGPTKDHVYRRGGDPELLKKQAIYHVEAHDQAADYKQTSGVTAWCGLDYASLNKNAYKGIKYPGVIDFFRIPKTGASFYQAQISPEIRTVIKPNFYWQFDSKSPEGPGKNSSVFSNCEMLKFYVNNKLHATVYPDREHFKNIKYPPFFVDLEIKDTVNPELRIEGYNKDKKVISKSYSSDTKHDEFFVRADDDELIGDGSDATRLEFKVTDKFGEERFFAGGNVSFEIHGPGIIVGDNPFSLDESSGVGAVWIKTVPKSSGTITVVVTHSTLGIKSIKINVKKDYNKFRL